MTASPLLLTSPKDGEELYLYLAVSEWPSTPSLCARNPTPSSRSTMHTPSDVRTVVKWAIELGEFDIEFRSRPAIKVQALADFIVEITIPIYEEQPAEKAEQPDEVPEWTLHVDGSSTDSGGGAGVVLTTPDGFEIKYSLKLDFSTTNNVAEYKALLVKLRLAKRVRKRLAVLMTQLIVNQVNGGFEANNPSLVEYLAKAREAIQGFDKLALVHVSRIENWKADRLARAAVVENQEQYLRDKREILMLPT
ncbi:hypothetical protein Nepgr_016923 [Nepenthes gracilis]|uniref:RNase H type-1 domain-containing protein n=1 Tax=Nepenthes gracilis TaxID=150966 RepID=A0AAD3SQ78_NEPGR|nr:hypothetical protein Nepgr_016923 [Nepenthes gracilis]